MSNHFDIRIQIGRRKGRGDPFPVRVRLPDGRRALSRLVYEPPAREALKPDATGFVAADHAAVIGDATAALFQSTILEMVSEGLMTAAEAGWDPRILLEIGSEEFYYLSWEYLVEHPPLLGQVPPSGLVRFSPHPSKLALVPFPLPIDVLVAEVVSVEESSTFPVQFGDPLRYFRASLEIGVSARDLPTLFRGRSFEVVHLQGHGRWREDSQGLLGAPGEEALGAGKLRSLLKRAGTRLVVLEALDAAHGPLLDIAHRLMGRSGPSVIVVSTYRLSVRPDWFLSQLYYSLVHDEALDVARTTSRSRGRIDSSTFRIRRRKARS